MSDFASCNQKNCPLNKECIRYMQSRAIYQWQAFFKYDFKNKKCDYFVPVQAGDTIRVLDD